MSAPLRPSLAATLLAVATFVAGAAASAGPPVPSAPKAAAPAPPALSTYRLSNAEMAEAMHTWVVGEQEGAAGFVGTGLLSIAGGALLLSQDGGFEQGAGATFAVMGGAITLFGVGYAMRLPGLQGNLSRQLVRDPAAYDREETARLQGIVHRFHLYRWAELAVGVTGVGLAVGGIAAKEDVVTGVGVGLASEASVLLVLDTFVEARGHRYLDQLRAWEPTFAVGPERVGVGLRHAL